MSRPQKQHRNGNNQLVNTRQALLDAALALMDRDCSFDAISLRKVTREVGLSPGAFYRHFSDMEALGMALVNNALEKLRISMSNVRNEATPDNLVPRKSVEILVNYVRANTREFQFIAREQFGGVAAIRAAIESQYAMLNDDLANDLAKTAGREHWQREDLHMLASLMIGAMTRLVTQVIHTDESGDYDALIEMGKKQLQLVIVGSLHWRTHDEASVEKML